jgi:membrane protein YdbS with pleckstrin-like domain
VTLREIRRLTTPLEQALLVMIPLAFAWSLLSAPWPWWPIPGAAILLLGAVVFALARRGPHLPGGAP